VANDDVAHDLTWRRLRLAETIAWCGLQKLQNNPAESDDVKRRRALGERAANHAFAAYQLEAASLFKWINRKKVKAMRDEASRMHAEARLDEIRPLAAQLRTAELKPASGLAPGTTDDAKAAIVERVCEARAGLLREAAKFADAAAIELGGGRILRYAPRGKTSDGAPGYDSKGFFDDECAPPWDTWVCYDGNELISHVPRVLCGLAQRGIEVDPVECIRWADDAMAQQLFALG
jgi:hypothetical protein